MKKSSLGSAAFVFSVFMNFNSELPAKGLLTEVCVFTLEKIKDLWKKYSISMFGGWK